MSYTDEAVKAKLASLTETQDSIVSVAQWIMFHRRQANRTAALWLSRLQDSTIPKRLNLIYLANEVVQQSRARGKQDFMLAFEPMVADGTAAAYKNASQDIQGKIRRVVEVWRQRDIFNKAILDAVEGRLAEIDRARSGASTNGSSSKGRLGGNLFGGGGSVPPELEGVAKSFGDLGKADASLRPAVNTANTEFAKMTDPNTPVPTPPVHAARLSALMRSLATAHGAVDASIKARSEVLKGLEKLLETHRGKLAEDEATATDLATRREGVEAKKKEVEDGIMRGLSTPSSPDIPTPVSAGNTFGDEGPRANGRSPDIATPEAEDFTPPPPDVETFTPPPQHAPEDDVTMSGDPAPFTASTDPREQSFTTSTGAEAVTEQPPQLNEPPPAFEPPSAISPTSPPKASNAAAAQANEFLNSLALGAGGGTVRQASTEAPDSGDAGEARDPRLKRRRMNPPKKEGEGDMFGGMGAMGGVDEEGIGALL
ncbi:uncharacterized protein LTR77_004846 [Saxophila tyrrhenica]|uniref:CID domain-containing protein n=1 Tax=Saxophila tyrrhenica TaxID=1690608 RepID=A0AAV9PAY1_9PEZI|nr:hypothetical protein LTR77_004846 [Saxophila tyrrhenica]